MEDKRHGLASVAVIVTALLLTPLMIFTALPNMFFGFENSETDDVIRMTEQARMIGSVYMSLENFEKSQIDSLVTSIAAEYEASGNTIDRIEVKSDFDEDDLLWLIAVNSVLHQQDLDSMGAADIRQFCTSRLTVVSLLEEAALKVEIGKIDPDQLMDQLGFDDEARTWAGVLYEVLSESNALDKYRDYFDVPPPSYEGDTSGGGSITPGGAGGSGDNAIDISAFISPGTKNNLDLAAYAIQAWENGWGYVWGTYGNILTQSLFDYKLQQYPGGVGKYADFIRNNWLNRRTADCVGLIKGYGWLDASSLEIKYGTNGMADYGANQMYQSATESGTMDAMPDIVGLAVWKQGHIGVYIGNGYVIEAMGTKYGVVKTELAKRSWSGWCKIPYIDYLE